jgi:hypothetical protein
MGVGGGLLGDHEMPSDPVAALNAYERFSLFVAPNMQGTESSMTGFPHIADMRQNFPDLADRMEAYLSNISAKYGYDKALRITSAYRYDSPEQVDVWGQKLRGEITHAAKPQALGGPGSPHTRTGAFDLGRLTAAQAALLGGYGLVQSVPGDWPHVAVSRNRPNPNPTGVRPPGNIPTPQPRPGGLL